MPWSSGQAAFLKRKRPLWYAVTAAGVIGWLCLGERWDQRQQLALANPPGGYDADGDSLPDEVELIFHTQPYLSDSDGDSYSDGMEWLMRTDPLDPAQVPVPLPAIRSHAYETTAGIHVFTVLWPGNLALIDRVYAFYGSPYLDHAPEGDETLGILDITPLIYSSLVQITSSEAEGFKLLSFTFRLTTGLMDSYSPLTVGLAMSIAGRPLVERMALFKQDDTRMVFFPDPSLVPGAGNPTSFFFQPLSPGGGGGGDPEYCLTEVGAGDPTEAGGIIYEVQSANCVPDGLLYCVAEDCQALAGQTLVTIDYGFLQSKASGN